MQKQKSSIVLLTQQNKKRKRSQEDIVAENLFSAFKTKKTKKQYRLGEKRQEQKEQKEQKEQQKELTFTSPHAAWHHALQTFHLRKGAFLNDVYAIPRNTLTPALIAEHTRRLTLSHESQYQKKQRQRWQKGGSRNTQPDEKATVMCWGNEEFFCVPPMYGVQYFGWPEFDLRSDGLRAPNLVFSDRERVWGKGDPFDQEAVLEKIRPWWKMAHERQALQTQGKQTRDDGTPFQREWFRSFIELPTSSGKTTLVCKTMSEYGFKTLVLLPNQGLISQWESRLKKFLPKARVGVIQSDRCEIKDKDVVLAMMASLSQRDYPIEPFREFGFLVVDECHKICAPTFSQVFTKIGFIKCSMGLSATIERNDGMEIVLDWCMGPVVERGNPITDASSKTTLVDIQYFGGLSEALEVRQRRDDTMDWVKTVSNLLEDPYRLQTIVTHVAKLLREGRNVLVLSHRTKYIDLMMKAIEPLLSSDIKKTMIYYHRKLKEDAKTFIDNNIHRLVFATIQYFGTGLDLQYLDTIMLVTPGKTIEQAIGRVRSFSRFERKSLMVVEFSDMFSSFQRQRAAKFKTYRKKGFIMGPKIVIKPTVEEMKARNALLQEKEEQRAKRKQKQKQKPKDRK